MWLRVFGHLTPLIIFSAVLVQAEDQPPPADEIYSQCSYISNHICYSDSSQPTYLPVISPPQFHDELLGKWTFNQLYPIDVTGHFFNLHPPPRSLGPDKLGTATGGSLWLHDTDASYTTSPSRVEILHPQSTIQFWIFVGEQADLKPRRLLAVGTLELYLKQKATGRGFQILAFAADSRCATAGEPAFATGFNLPQKQWIHVAVSSTASAALLYVNGIQTAQSTPMDSLSGFLEIGKSTQCGGGASNVFLDDLEIWQRHLPVSELRASLLPVLSHSVASETRFKVLGSDLTAADVNNACSEGGNDEWAVCTDEEFYAVMPDVRVFLHRQGLLGTNASEEEGKGSSTSLKEPQQNIKKIPVWTQSGLLENPPGISAALGICCATSGRKSLPTSSYETCISR